MNTLAIIITCGKEEEVAPGTETAFLSLGNLPVLGHSLKTYQQSRDVDGIIVVVSKEHVESASQIIKRYGISKFRGMVIGGVNRLNTLRTVFSKLPEPANTIILQESSRPFVRPEIIHDTVKAAKRYGCAIAAHKVPDSVKVAAKGLKLDETLDRNAAWITQSPQVFRSEVLEKIIDPKNKTVKIVDDESAFVTKPSEVHLVEAGVQNMKIRTSFDLAVATALLNAKLTD